MALADGELEEPRKSEVERWLGDHPGHQRRQQQNQRFFRYIGEVARSLPPLSPPVDLTEGILAAIEAEAIDRESTPSQSGPRARQPAQVLPVQRPLAPRFLVAATLAFAAAAALALWWKATPLDAPSAPLLVASSRLPTPDAEDDAVVSDDSTAITSIDLGNQSGAVFYVRGQTTASAVLWIDDTTPPPAGTP
jgi:negative regulator of sigma E activity